VSELTFADQRLVALFQQRTGLLFSTDRMAQCARRLGYSDVSIAYEQLSRASVDGAVWQPFLRELALGETYFFREIAPLESALNTLMTRHDTHGLRVWSAGCATGEEPYTLALLIREYAPDARWPLSILGTDINEYALATARRAVYGSWSLRVQGSLLRGDFVPHGERWQVAEAIRQQVTFRSLNLADENAAYPTADLIVCRNVLMYLDPVVQARIRARLDAALAPGGILIEDGLPTSVVLSAIKPTMPLAEPADAIAMIVPSAEPISLYDQARTAADKYCWQDAHRLLDAAPPLDLPCAWLRAVIYQQQGDVDSAVRALRRCLYIDHNFVIGYFALGNLYAAQGSLSMAQRQWQNASQLAAAYAPDDRLPFGEGITAAEVCGLIREQTV